MVATDMDDPTRKRDYAAAGIPHQDDQGMLADFHSGRATFRMSLIEAGFSPHVCQLILALHA
jgi:hypothetical protein